MAYDVARVRGLHPSLGDGWVHFDAQNGMLLPDAVARAVSTAFRGSMPTPSGPHPSAQRSAAVLDAARQAVADLVNADPEGVVLGADRAVLLTSLADSSSARVGLGYEMVVTRLDDEANIAPWLRAANRYGAKVKWAEVDIETGELPNWQWEGLITRPDPAGRNHLGLIDFGHRHRSAGGDQAGARHRRTGGRRSLRGRAVPTDRHRRDRRGRGRRQRDGLGRTADRRTGVPRPVDHRLVQLGVAEPLCDAVRRGWRSARISSACSPASWRASSTWPRWTSRRSGTRRERLAVSMQSAATYMSRLFDYLLISLRSLPAVMVIGRPEMRIPVLSFAVSDVPAERVVQRLADNGILAISNASSRVLDVIGVNDIGGAVTVGLAHYTTTAEVDQLVRALASLG